MIKYKENEVKKLGERKTKLRNIHWFSLCKNFFSSIQ